jgi:hypothetical protein
MARPASFELSCINVRVHSKHEASEYSEFWKMLYQMRRPLVTRSGIALMIGEAYKESAGPRPLYSGAFYRFIQINPDDPWFDIEQHKPADQQDVKKISIPAHLRPNLQSIPYIFDLASHRLYVMSSSKSGTLSPASVLRLVSELSGHHKVTDRFKAVDLTISTRRQDVEKLFSWRVLQRVEITVERTNPSDFEDEAKVFQYLTNLGAQRETRGYVKASDAKTITPDDDMRALAAVAADNGLVSVKGINTEGKPDRATSQDYPWRRKSTYNRKVQTLMDAFRGVVESIGARLP